MKCRLLDGGTEKNIAVHHSLAYSNFKDLKRYICVDANTVKDIDSDDNI